VKNKRRVCLESDEGRTCYCDLMHDPSSMMGREQLGRLSAHHVLFAALDGHGLSALLFEVISSLVRFSCPPGRRPSDLHAHVVGAQCPDQDAGFDLSNGHRAGPGTPRAFSAVAMRRSMMKSGDTISSLLGVGFLACAGIILGGPGGALNLKFGEWSEASSLRKTVREQWTELSNSGRVLGSATGETRLVLFLDYQCVYCRDSHDSLQVALREDSQMSVAVRYKVSPRSRLSRRSAVAAICAAEQGQFGQMHDHLLTNTEWMVAEGWEQVGREAGIRDIPNWLNCLLSDRTDATLAVDSTWAAQLSLRGTPSLITERAGVHLGIVPISTLEEWWR